MPITPVPTPYPQRGQRATFADRLDAFIAWLIGAPAQFDALAASLNSLAAGSANKLAYTIDLSSTTMADPGAGKLRFNSATQNTATALALDVVGSDTVDYTALIGTFSASTSTVLGTLRLEKAADPTKYLLFNVTALTLPTGYRQLTVTCTASSAASPFVANDAVLLSFSRTGDKGDTGSTPAYPTLRVRDERANGTSPETAINGVNTRVLNTVKKNTISGASLSSNQVTLPSGTYKVTGTCPAYSSSGAGHQAYLYNITDASVAVIGTSENCSGNSTRSIIEGEMTIAAAKAFEVRHKVSGTGALGAPGSGGVGEVYTEIAFEKVA